MGSHIIGMLVRDKQNIQASKWRLPDVWHDGLFAQAHPDRTSLQVKGYS